MARSQIPWFRSAVVVVAMSGSLWGSGIVGAMGGRWAYQSYWMPDPPFTEEQLRSMETLAPATLPMAEQETALWRRSTDVGLSIAGVQGALVGTVLVLALWVTGVLIWLFAAERRRQREAAPLIADRRF